MALPDGPRQILAGIIAACAFLALYVGVELSALPALVLATGAYGVVLLLVGRRAP